MVRRTTKAALILAAMASMVTAVTMVAASHPWRDHDRRAADPGRPPYAGKTSEITVGSDTYQITVEDGITLTAPRTTSRDIRRHKASAYPPARS
jgi:hypothetical protein